MSEEYWTAGPLARWPGPRARGSPSCNQAGAMGDEATAPCTGSIPAKPWNLELKPRQASNYPILGTLVPFRLRAERFGPS